MKMVFLKIIIGEGLILLCILKERSIITNIKPFNNFNDCLTDFYLLNIFPIFSREYPVESGCLRERNV
jgi:hypothetical protein